MSDKQVPKQVSEYMASIGAKGGSANPAGTKKRSDQARAAVNARWEKFRKENPGKAKGKK